jgi:hypothetical protein
MDLPRIGPGAGREDRFGRALELVRAAETVRTVFPGSETIGELGVARVAVLTPRTRELGRKVSALRTLLDLDVDREGSTARVWIEGLPSNDAAAGALLGELART